ncbi:MAG TPA: radical SAM protein [Phycisphaerae bacterium]|nr:radical SAM protein [Phycisphaerae bacterium]HUT57942.1 radical SAM protein [Phycisphaerae bacterium]
MSRSQDNVARLREVIRDCTLCPRRCRVDRQAGQVGSCRIGAEAVVASAGPHFGEEPPLVGAGGSGTIFLAGCNLHCAFCQNFDISQDAAGRKVTPAQLAAIALGLQARGCENVNFVTPTHVAHAVAEAIRIARGRGLNVPIVYNCGGYESVEMLGLLAGLVEIYMPDFKYADAAAAAKYSDAKDYPAVATAALAEMYRQVGPLALDDRGVAARGLLVRHLVLPGDLAGSEKVIDIVAATAPGCTINVMAQYRPAYRAAEFPELMSRPSPAEIARLREHAGQKGLVLTN